MVYKKILIPDQRNHTIEMPAQFYGKKVEIIVVELSDSNESPVTPPSGRKTAVKELFETSELLRISPR